MKSWSRLELSGLSKSHCRSQQRRYSPHIPTVHLPSCIDNRRERAEIERSPADSYENLSWLSFLAYI